MANISYWLKKIKTAGTGKEMRPAIYNSIDLINQESSSVAAKQKVLEDKYNNQIKNMSNSNPSVSEVVDARTNERGINYNTLGERMTAERVDGGCNLLKATALKKNMDYISYWSMGVADKTKTDIHISDVNLTPHGNRYWVISNTDISGYFGIRQNISLRLLANTTYTLSYWIMPTENNVGQALVSIQYKDANKNNIYHTHYYKNSSLILNKWNKLTYTFTTKENMDRSYVTCALSTQTTAWHGNFGDFKLELGSHSTDWSPSPDDEPLWANPVGSVKISATADNPSTTIGGVWEQTCQGRKPVGVGTGTDINGLSKTFTLGEKGGEYKHSQTEEEGFKHRHMQNVIAEGNSFGWDGKDHIRKDYGGDLKTASSYPQHIATDESGGGKPMNIIDPFQAFYFWKRTA